LLILEVGADISYQRTNVELITTSGTKSESVSSELWLPLLNAALVMHLIRAYL
jgi:hypothetical protein